MPLNHRLLKRRHIVLSSSFAFFERKILSSPFSLCFFGRKCGYQSVREDPTKRGMVLQDCSLGFAPGKQLIFTQSQSGFDLKILLIWHSLVFLGFGPDMQLSWFHDSTRFDLKVILINSWNLSKKCYCVCPVVHQDLTF